MGGQHHLRLRDGPHLRELDGYQSIYIDRIAKNFETLEPGIAFRVLRQYLERRYGAEGAAKRIFATGTPGSTLPLTSLPSTRATRSSHSPRPSAGGTRWAATGLFLTAVAGYPRAGQGMRDMRRISSPPRRR